MKSPSRITRVLILLIAGLMTTSCLTSSDPKGPEGVQMGQLVLSIVDAPPAGLDSLQSLFVRFASIRVHRSDEDTTDGWVTAVNDTMLTAAQRTVDLLTLVGGTDYELSTSELEVGTYGQVRVVVDTAWAVFDHSSVPLGIPSGFQTGIKLVGSFDILTGITTTLVLDFDVGRSLFRTGGGTWKLRPTIRYFEQFSTGAIAGTVLPKDVGLLVTAYWAGTNTIITTAIPDTSNGAYMLQGLTPGVYDVEAEADGYTAVRVEGLSVIAGQVLTLVDFTLTPP